MKVRVSATRRRITDRRDFAAGQAGAAEFECADALFESGEAQARAMQRDATGHFDFGRRPAPRANGNGERAGAQAGASHAPACSDNAASRMPISIAASTSLG